MTDSTPAGRTATPDASGLPCPFCGASRPADDSACTACGKPPIVCGAWRVRGLLGRGGMGAVYGAIGVADGRRAAVKVLRVGAGGDWKAYELFERSTRVLQGLDHPGLPRVHAFEAEGAGTLLLVRDPFDGGSLQSRVEAGARVDGKAFRRLLRRLLEVLDYLHGRVPPVLHRNIKPANVMFRTAGDWDPVLVDFDTVAAPGPQGERLTIVVTPGYTAPEQLAGDPGPASDLFSLGATMLFVATHTDPDELPRRHGRFDVGGLLAGMDPVVRAVLLKLAEPDPGRRYASAADALKDLAANRAPRPAGEPPRQKPERSPEPDVTDEDVDDLFDDDSLSAEALEAQAEAEAAGEADADAPDAVLELAREGREARRAKQRLDADRARSRSALEARKARWQAARSTTWLGNLMSTGVLVGLLLAVGVGGPLLALSVPSLSGMMEGAGAAWTMALSLCAPVVAAVVALIASRRGLRREEAWIDGLPFPVANYWAALGQDPIGQSIWSVTVTFRGAAPGSRLLADAVAGLGERVPAGAKEAGERTVRFVQSFKWGEGVPSTNGRQRAWFHRLVEGVLLPLRDSHPVERVDVRAGY